MTLVAPEREIRVFLPHDPKAALRVTSVEDIFRLKCLDCADRSKSRDWFDLYLMHSNGRFSPIEVLKTFQTAGAPAKFDIAMRRLRQAAAQSEDEGYESLLPRPPTPQQMKDFFNSLRDQIEAQATSERIGKERQPNKLR
ncbi:MAG: nucleotidyl transferase AbiEii/AbiGii toxin family protein [Hydrogenophaga sp.]